MKTALTAICILITGALLVSCSDDKTESLPPNADDHSSHLSVTPDDGLDGLSLDSGQKWKMDDHTRSVFSEMAESFLGSDHSHAEEETLKKAGSDLQDLITKLVQGCTMTGAAHDQLHVYLTGYIPAVAALSETGQIENAKTVKRYLEMYGQYFE